MEGIVWIFLNLAAIVSSVSGIIQIVPRKEWGAREPRKIKATKIPIQHVFIHHTGGYQCQDEEACAKTVKQIQNFDMDISRWYDIGYNFLAGGDGRIYEGRGWNHVGAYAVKYVNVSISLSFMGNFASSVPDPEKYKRIIRKFINYGVAKSLISTTYQLHGHRDLTCTSCPGNALYDILKNMRKFVAGKLPGYKC